MTTWAQATPKGDLLRNLWQDGREAYRTGRAYAPHEVDVWRRGWICEAELARAATDASAGVLGQTAQLEIRAALDAADVVATHLVTARPSAAQRQQIEEAREAIRRALQWFGPATAA